MLKRMAIIVLLLPVILLTNSPPTAEACSGYPYFGVEDLPTMELLVRATAIDADDRGHNAVLRIEEYY